MITKKIYLILLISVLSLKASAQNGTKDYVNRAISLFESVYEGNISNIENFASDEILISYPIFLKRFNQKALHGIDAYKEFARKFNSNWKDGKVTIHESISEGNKVVLIWSFKAIRINQSNQSPDAVQEFSWGGISVFRFNDAGKIIEEFGEESNPGPYNRLN